VTDSGGQTTNPVVAKLRSWSANATEEVIEYRGDTTIVVPRKVLRSIAEQCRDIEELKFNLLTDATCLDRYPLEPRFELNYQLISIPFKKKLTIRVKLSGSDPVVDSLFPVWKGSNWLEREIFDMFGIRFTGHPDLRRILLPDDWEGHPLRKDYPVEGYRDIPAIATRYTRSRP
jgi:NADH-quinone oxidoreductase subunit C